MRACAAASPPPATSAVTASQVKCFVRHPEQCAHSVFGLQAAAAAHAELADLKAKYGGLTRQYDEAVHKINLAKQASWREVAAAGKI